MTFAASKKLVDVGTAIPVTIAKGVGKITVEVAVNAKEKGEKVVSTVKENPLVKQKVVMC